MKVRARTGCEQASVNHYPERSCSIKEELQEVTEESGGESKWKKTFDCGRSKEREMWEEGQQQEGSKEKNMAFMPSCDVKCHMSKELLCEDLLLERGGASRSSSYKLVALLRNEV
jgi:hypothetical protein